MAAQFKFQHKGVTVLVYEKSVKMTGMHDCLFLGHTPDVDQIKRMIDAIQQAAESPAQQAWSRHRVRVHREPTWREKFLRWWYEA